ncbi:hypothetical protein OG339_40170 [Streptosporangium sp. NBC_01495]|uniref:hypothetical protein n=1 Tax=Streptosporangium sp. NBC_01495 TaxID=2903899 RepID=UPI002E341F80|nr:hypothetical protein [Streptosporangium sp. NBC_01495]
MEFWKTILDLARRKRVGFPLVGLALLAAVAVFLLVPPRYVSSASMVLTTPPAGGTTDPAKPLGRSNPLLQFSDGLKTTAGILILSMNTEAVATELGIVKDGPVEVTINDGRTNPSMLGILMNGPFVYVEVESDSVDVTRTVMARAQFRLRTELVRRQEVLGAPRPTFIGFVEVVPAGYPAMDRSGTWQAAGGASFVVVLLGLGAVYAVERRRVFRRRSDAGWSGESRPATDAAPFLAPVPVLASDAAPATADQVGEARPGDLPEEGGEPGGGESRGGRNGRGGKKRGGRDHRSAPEPPVTVYPAEAVSPTPPAPEGAASRESSGWEDGDLTEAGSGSGSGSGVGAVADGGKREAQQDPDTVAVLRTGGDDRDK